MAGRDGSARRSCREAVPAGSRRQLEDLLRLSNQALELTRAIQTTGAARRLPALWLARESR
jgi:hypothetical protein